MIVRAMVLITILGLAACERIPGTAQHKQAVLFKSVQSRIAYDLKDPGSAQFRGLHQEKPLHPLLHKGMPASVVCGEVNAKNSYGGYIGFTRFVADVGTPDYALDPADHTPTTTQGQLDQAEFQLWWLSDCARLAKPK